MAANGSLVKLQEFHKGTGEIEVHCDRIEQYFIANEIKDDNPRRAAILLSSIDNETYKLLQDLCFPDKPSAKTYKELVVILKDQLSQKRSVFAERYKFHKAQQLDGENVLDWAAKLKRLSTYCVFGINLDIMLRDRFIVGLKDPETVNRLFKEDEAITFNRAVDVATQVETARLHTREVRNGEYNNATRGIHKLSFKNKSSTHIKPLTPLRKSKNSEKEAQSNYNSCYRCGRTNHTNKDCRYANYKCRSCGKIGHLAKVCRSKRESTESKQCHWNTEEESEQVQIFHIQSKYNKSINIKVKIAGIPIMMEVDSGSGGSTMAEKEYRKYFSKYKLKTCEITLINYTQGRDKPVGLLELETKWENKTTMGKFVIVRNGGPPLCGRDMMEALGLGIAKVHNLESSEHTKTIIDQFEELFKEGLGEYKYAKVHLELEKGTKPVYCKPRPLPFTMKTLVEKELARLEKEGTITTVETSEWGTPLVPRLKKNGSIRICADYKITLNKHLKAVKYPLPRIEDIFAKLEGGVEFSKLDMNQAYNQLKLDEESAKISTWSTHKGLFRVNRLPYGVAPAAAKFQRMLEQILQGIEGVTNFLDDILITGKNRAEHMSRLEMVLGKLQKAGLRLNKNKCELFQKEVKYLGYSINKEGLHKDKGKIEAMVRAKRPTNVGEVRAIIGTINYYSKFLPNIATILKPLYRLLNKGVEFEWSEECEAAFKQIKELLMSDCILAHYDPKLQLKLYCDASKYGIGAVLMQINEAGTERPIAFTARTLTKSEINYAMIEKEALAIFYAVKHFHQYLYGRNFTLATDHKPLTTIFGEHKGIPQMAAGRLQRWALFLSGYNYTIQYIQGKYNYSADFLSRSVEKEPEGEQEEEEYTYLNFIESCQETPIDSKIIKQETRKDPQLSRVQEYINNGWPETIDAEMKPFWKHRDELTTEQGCVLWGYRVVVPGKLRDRLMQELHSTHQGIVKVKHLARAYMWWPGIDGQLEDMIRACTACATNRAEPNKALLIPWQRPKQVWERVHMDYLGPLEGKMYLLIIDAYSKWPEIMEVEQANTEQTLDKTREVMARFGIPRHIVTDNGTQFTSDQFRAFTKKNGIKHTFTAPGHPATNGQAENGVKSFKTGFNKAMADDNNKGVSIKTLVSRYLLGYRNTIHCTTLESPAKLMFGRELRTRLSLIKPDTERLVEDAQEKQQRNFRGKRNLQLGIGDVVTIRDYSKINKKEWKQATIREKLGPRTYLCELKDGRRWKRHLDQINKGVGTAANGDIGEFRESLQNYGLKEGDGIRPEPDDGEDMVQPDIELGITNKVRKSGRVIKAPDRMNL